ncbi:MAG: hypothetical protein IPL61_14320 [Myxococcales bacterium]|nr:hypothetical protein [Myxococcales bacterium]
MRTIAVMALTAALAAGCGSRCAEVKAARATLAARPVATAPGPDVRVTVPLARANALVAELLARTPLVVPLDLPDLGPIALEVPGGLRARARAVELRPGPLGRVRIAFELEIVDDAAPLATLALVAEVAPEVVRADGAVTLELGVRPADLLALTPTLGPDATAALGAAIVRWLPPSVRGRAPRLLVDAAAGKLATYLTGAAYQALRATLLVRLGEATRLRLRLPDVPIADVQLRSIDAPAALVVELHTGLPIRRGLAPIGAPTVAADVDVDVAIAASAVAELANWAIASGPAPRWYDRSLTPTPTGDFRPRFDYVADDAAHPWKVHVLQERGGCSYFRVGVRVAIALEGDQLRATALDRELERAIASPVIQVAAWAKYVVVGSLDRSRRRAAQVELAVAGEPLTTRATRVELVDDELRVGVALALAPPSTAPPSTTPPSAAPPTTAAAPSRCYPYLARGDGPCRTACATRDDCAGSRGPADLAEHGWPLDCIQRACVPLPPDHVR